MGEDSSSTLRDDYKAGGSTIISTPPITNSSGNANISRSINSNSHLSSKEDSRTNMAHYIYNKKSTKRRVRVVKACNRCRSHKTKCSGTLPCSSCVKNQVQCTYSTRDGIDNKIKKTSEIKSGKNISTNLPDGSTSDLRNISPYMTDEEKDKYIAALEARVEKLESLQSLNFENSSSSYNQDETAVSTTEVSHYWKYLCRHQSILTFKLFKTIYDNLSDESKLQVSMPREQNFGWNMSGGRYLTPDKLPNILEFEIRSGNFYVNYFFSGINSVFAILHEVVFRKQLESYEALILEERNSTTGRNDETKLHETRLFQSQLYLVYAISIRFSEFQNPKSNSGNTLALEEKLFKYAYKVIQILSFQWESFELIQGWLLIALYLRIAHRLTSSFMALGNAITMTRAMGLNHRDPTFCKGTNYQHLKAKRIFWCVYTFDKLFGIQYGRYFGILDTDIFLPYPTMNFQLESDGWLTTSAFAMIHLASISSIMNDLANDRLTDLDVQHVCRKLDDLEMWLNGNGFRDDDFLTGNDIKDNLAELAKIQVKLHYYDLLFYIHGRSVFGFIGEDIANIGWLCSVSGGQVNRWTNFNLERDGRGFIGRFTEKLSLQAVLEASKKSLLLFLKLKEVKLLDVPWYMTLQMIFNIGIYSALFINSGVFLKDSRENLANSILLISYLQEASFIEPESNKLEQKFTMAKECLWALKMLNHMIVLRFRDNAKDIMNIGIDHGSNDVNKRNFVQLGRVNDEYNIENEPNLNYKGINVPSSVEGIALSDNTYLKSQIPTPLSMNSLEFNFDSLNQTENENLMENLRWFDQWLNFI